MNRPRRAFLVAAISLCAPLAGDCSAATPQPAPGPSVPYITFMGDHLTLYPWSGQLVTLLTPTRDLDAKVMGQVLSVFDAVYEYYDRTTGNRPGPAKTYDGRDTIAVVNLTCGAGCGYLGSTGIELDPGTFDALYSGVLANNQFDQVVFYEFGRNFWFYDAQIQYQQPDSQSSVATGYAVFMRFMAMDATHVRPGPYLGYDFAFFRASVENLVDQYEADPTLNWDNTLRAGNWPTNQPFGLESTDLFASFLLRLTKAFGSRFVDHVWIEVGKRPAAGSTQQAVDNFVLAASAAAGANLVEIFGSRWRWPVSLQAKEEARTRFGKPIDSL